MIPIDKQAHFLSGGFIAAIAWPFGVVASIAAVLVAAVGKEVYDKLHPESHTADIWDAVATIAGGAVMQIWFLIFM